jgi:hypothetical protein
MLKEAHKLKIGLAAVMCTAFTGDKETQYIQRGIELQILAQQMGFELNIISQGIYNLEQSKAAASELSDWGADFVLLQVSAYGSGDLLYPFTEIKARLGLWAVPEGAPTKEGYLPLNSLAGVNLYNSMFKTFLTGYRRPVKWFYGEIGQHLFDQRLLVTVQALNALVNLQKARIGLIGGTAPTYDSLVFDERHLYELLGIRVVPIEIDTIINHAEKVDEKQVENAKEKILSGAVEFDQKQQKALDRSGRVLVSFQKMAEDLELDALAVSCWPRFQSLYHLGVCSVLGAANSSGLVTACEGSVAGAISMLGLKHMSNSGIVTIMGLSSIDECDDSILMWHCGPTSPMLADAQGTRMGSLHLFDGVDADPMGLHNDLVLKPEHGTIMGFTPDFQRLLVIDGQFDNTKPSYKGSRGWLKSIKLNGNTINVPDLMQTLMASGFPIHYPIVFGDFAEASLELAAWLDVEPIQHQVYSSYLKRDNDL